MWFVDRDPVSSVGLYISREKWAKLVYSAKENEVELRILSLPTERAGKANYITTATTAMDPRFSRRRIHISCPAEATGTVLQYRHYTVPHPWDLLHTVVIYVVILWEGLKGYSMRIESVSYLWDVVRQRMLMEMFRHPDNSNEGTRRRMVNHHAKFTYQCHSTS